MCWTLLLSSVFCLLSSFFFLLSSCYKSKEKSSHHTTKPKPPMYNKEKRWKMTKILNLHKLLQEVTKYDYETFTQLPINKLHKYTKSLKNTHEPKETINERHREIKIQQCVNCYENFNTHQWLARHYQKNNGCALLGNIEKLSPLHCANQNCNTWWANQKELDKHKISLPPDKQRKGILWNPIRQWPYKQEKPKGGGPTKLRTLPM